MLDMAFFQGTLISAYAPFIAQVIRRRLHGNSLLSGNFKDIIAFKTINFSFSMSSGMWSKLYNWVVYPIMMTMNLLAFIFLSFLYEKDEFNIKDLVALLALVRYTIALTKMRLNRGQFRTNVREAEPSTNA